MHGRFAKALAATVLIALAGTLPGTALAALITLDPLSTGSITRTRIVGIGAYAENYRSDIPLASLAYYPPGGFGQVRSDSLAYGFLLFDLSSIPFLIESATVELDVSHGHAGMAITGLTAMQAQALSDMPTGSNYYPEYDAQNGTPEQQANYYRARSGFDDIQNGVTLGALPTGGPSGVYNVSLNSLGLEFLNGSRELIGFGITWPIVEGVGDLVEFNATPRLHLSGGASTVPAPGTLALLLSAVSYLLHTMRRRAVHS